MPDVPDLPDLHLTGIHEDGEHLLLSSFDNGSAFLLPIDDALRAAVRRGQGGPSDETAAPMSPVEVQAMIRAGASAEEAAERAGWPVEKVHRYEGPILAERSHVAGLAGRAHLRDRSGLIVTLSDRVTDRLQERGVDPEHTDWDAWRSQDGQWTVDISFAAGGKRRTASWHFSRSSMTVTPVDDESRWLGADDTAEQPPARREVVARHAVYDVESDPRERRRDEPTDPDSEITSSLRERAAARTVRRRTARRLPHTSTGSGVEQPSIDEAPAATQVGFTSSSATDIPAPTGEIPDDAVPLEPLGYDPETMDPPPPAHAQPDVDGPDGQPEPAARAHAERVPAPRRPRRQRARRATAPRTREPEPELLAEKPAEKPAQKPAQTPEAAHADSPAVTVETVETVEAAVAATETVVTTPATPSTAVEPTGERSRSVASDTVDEPLLPLDHDDHDGHEPHDHHEPHDQKGQQDREQEPAPRSGAASEGSADAGDPAPSDEPPTAPGPTPSPAQKRTVKRGRASVPAWDDIMFGAKPPSE